MIAFLSGGVMFFSVLYKNIHRLIYLLFSESTTQSRAVVRIETVRDAVLLITLHSRIPILEVGSYWITVARTSRGS